MEEMTAYWMQKCYELWKLLDDIDMASDMFKTDYKGLATYTYLTQQKRWKVLGIRDTNLLYEIFHKMEDDEDDMES